MKIFSMLRFLTVPLAFALFGITLPTSVAAQGGVILPTVPTISIKATVAETREPFCDPAICDAAPPPPAVIRVTRTGGDLTMGVSVFVAYEGSASNGVDYAKLPDVLRFPAGAESVDLYVEGLFDQLAEGDEIVVAKLLPDPSMGPIGFYRLDTLQSAARVLIHDREMSIEPMVSIVASSEIAEETSYPYRRLAFRGVFTIARSGPTNHAVSVFVHYSGSAQPGVDFPALPWLVTIPAGAEKVELVVEPTVDNVSEPIEFLDAKLDQCPPLTNPPMGIPCYAANIDPARSTARVFLRDDGITTASLELTSPRDGSEFRAGQPIRLAATAIDLEGAITYVEFYDGPTKVGESSIFFIRQPDPGTPIHHEIEWTGAAIGSHELTARAVNAAGSKVSSPPVKIRVSDGLPVVSIEATVPETMEPSPTSRIRPGVFTLRRTGDTARALRVWVSYGGTASPERDYSELPGIVEFPAGSSSVDLQVVPLDDGLAETDESVVAELVPSPLAVRPDYEIDPINRRAVVVIHDNEMAVPLVSVRATQPITSEPCPVCLVVPGVFTITRTGSTDAPLGVWYRLSGTAVIGLPYPRLPRLRDDSGRTTFGGHSGARRDGQPRGGMRRCDDIGRSRGGNHDLSATAAAVSSGCRELLRHNYDSQFPLHAGAPRGDGYRHGSVRERRRVRWSRSQHRRVHGDSFRGNQPAALSAFRAERHRSRRKRLPDSNQSIGHPGWSTPSGIGP
ncbi:MAG: hypothetical protein IPK15_25790 [Verrucomicrobia bacterium]|nr:hypothetical protein [Verrucomicrobiota bacterium]